ncbi:MAG: hypothetical protein PSN04_01005 [Methyloprofundus sp.]|nr:hypothetical protein [Methyloprofundus sp.]
MTDDELKALVASLAVESRKTEILVNSLAAESRKTEILVNSLAAESKKTDAQMKRTDEKLERIGIRLGNVTNNQGDVAEEFFYNSLIKNTHLGNLQFDDITRNMEKHRGKIQEEYDLFLTNGNAIAVVEVKYKAHSNDLDKLERKINHFKKLFPIYKDYKLYGALASFFVNDDTKREALERGYFVLQREGDLIHSEHSQFLNVA